ncbi:MAG: DUF6314 family protein [Gemmatimonadales bacterium]
MPSLATPTTLDLLWTRLRAVRRVVLEVTGAETQGRRNAETEGRRGGAAEGVVEWLNGRPQEITWRERGQWTAGPLTGTRFSSGYSWTRRPDGTLSISHVRFGIERPVALVELVEDDAGVWRSLLPHHCAEDRYAAAVEIEKDGVIVTWTVTGPTTGYVLRARYLGLTH